MSIETDHSTKLEHDFHDPEIEAVHLEDNGSYIDAYVDVKSLNTFPDDPLNYVCLTREDVQAMLDASPPS